ncbi:hypothetical protein XaFJ1_GM002368 [Xanthomonas albilineans]|nr:hypothetical protein XaFJ1_GM002368 [Xanthomonas albilineans]
MDNFIKRIDDTSCRLAMNEADMGDRAIFINISRYIGDRKWLIARNLHADGAYSA